jgi:threonine dehydrogenase-like Zn-dependent dehydrogenase
MSMEALIRRLAKTGSVEVVGANSRADAVRGILGEGARTPSGQRPSLIIETTGETAAVEAALRRVDDLGTVVIAGPVPLTPVRLDLYADLHVRGLTLVGVTSQEESTDGT